MTNFDKRKSMRFEFQQTPTTLCIRVFSTNTTIPLSQRSKTRRKYASEQESETLVFERNTRTDSGDDGVINVCSRPIAFAHVRVCIEF